MRRFLSVLFILMLAGTAFAEYRIFDVDQTAYGRLTVYSDVSGADIYVDAKFVGQDRATISNIPTGKHYVRVVKGENTIQSGIVEVKEQEETIIVAKLDESELLSKVKRQNFVFFFGNASNLDYVSTAGTTKVTASYDTLYGLGGEVHYAIPFADLVLEVGFLQNFPAMGEIEDLSFLVGISSSNVNLVKELIKYGGFKVRAGAGLNYSLYSAGSGTGTGVGIASKLGHQFVLEAIRALDVNQVAILRVGYVNYNGESTLAVANISNSGYFGQFGLGYKL